MEKHCVGHYRGPYYACGYEHHLPVVEAHSEGALEDLPWIYVDNVELVDVAEAHNCY